MRKFVWFLFLSLFFIIQTVSRIIAEDISTAKLAIVDVGTQKKVPEPFMDLLLVAFGNYSEITLLERTEINKLLREHALALSMSGNIDKDVIKVGRLWATDAFLMLEVPKDSGSDITVRIMLVDTHYGLKIWDSAFILNSQLKTYQNQAAILANATAQRLAKIRESSDNLIMIGVTTFRSDEISKRWDWLSEALPTGIEQHLALFPGIILMERTKTRTLTEERELVEGLPEALRASAVLVDGAYKINREKGLDTISLYLRCRRNNKILLEERIEGSLNKTSELYQKTACLVVNSIGLKKDSKPMDPLIEAEMLAGEAKAYLIRREPERALPPAEAAFALVPNSLQYNELLLSVLNTGLGKYYLDLSDDDSEKNRIDWYNCSVKTLLRASPLVERIVTETYSQADYFPTQVEEYFNTMLNVVFRCRFSRYPLYLDNEMRIYFNEIRECFWNLYRLCHGKFKGKSDRNYEQLLSFGERAYCFCTSTEQAIEFSREVLFESVKLFNAHPKLGYDIRGLLSLVTYLDSPGLSEWPREKDSIGKIVTYLNELTGSDDPIIRFHAEAASMSLYEGKDFDKFQRHCEKFISVFKNEILENFPGLDYSWVYCQIVNARFSNEEEKDLAIKTRYFLELLEFVYQKGIFCQNETWVECTLETADYLERDNKIREASTFLKKSIAELQKKSQRNERLSKALRALQQRHPELMKKDTKGYKIMSIFSLKDNSVPLQLKKWSPGSTNFRRLVLNDKIFAIVCSGGVSKEQFAVIKLDRENFKPLSFQSSPIEINFETRDMGLIQEYIYGPAVTTNGDDIYIGFSQDGIMVFSKDGRAELMNEDNGLACNNIQSLDILDDKLYAVIGEFQKDAGLMEVDLKFDTSRILFSTRSKVSVPYISGTMPVLKIAVDSVRHALWLAFRNSSTEKISIYYPKEQRFMDITNISVIDIGRMEVNYLGKFENLLYLGGTNGLITFDLNSKAFTSLFREYGRNALYSKWKYPSPRIMPRRVVVRGKNLVCADTLRVGYFQDGQEKVNYIWEEKDIEYCTFLVGRARDIAMSENGLLLLTDDTLYVVPEIR